MTRITDWDVVSVGDDRAPFTDAPLTITDFVRYQGASNDMNPIHHDPEFARASGFDQPFAVGMLQAGVMAGYVTRWFPPETVRRFRVQFREQAWPGDVITYAGTVVGKSEDAGRRSVELELRATRQTGDVHLLAWATLEL